jgi:two-component system response regulator AlgR
MADAGLSRPLRVLVVDDEALARSRMRTLLSESGMDLELPPVEASQATHAMSFLQHEPFDLVLLDIHMPGADGLALARTIRALPLPPAVVFVTAHAEHAVQAFELDAVDYLTKPVRQERLQAALQKVARFLQARRGNGQTVHVELQETLLIQERTRVERVPLHQVLYFKAELKYITVRTAAHSFVLENSLSELEDRYGARFVRVHRNALVARHAISALQKHFDPEEGDCWAVRLNGVDELITVSRRQLPTVRELLAQ